MTVQLKYQPQKDSTKKSNRIMHRLSYNNLYPINPIQKLINQII